MPKPDGESEAPGRTRHEARNATNASRARRGRRCAGLRRGLGRDSRRDRGRGARGVRGPASSAGGGPQRLRPMTRLAHSATVLHILDQNPNKRGVVELQMVEMSAQLRARGWRMICCYNREAPGWLQDWMHRAGGELVALADPGRV